MNFLGIEIDPRLTWLDHINSLLKKLTKATYAVRRMEKTAGHEPARSAYFALFHARMAYAIEIWGHSTHIKLVLGQQKKAVRAVGGGQQYNKLQVTVPQAQYFDGSC